jgi:hypothetical protein
MTINARVHTQCKQEGVVPLRHDLVMMTIEACFTYWSRIVEVQAAYERGCC